MVKPGDRKNVVAYLMTTHQVSITRACKTIHFAKSMYYYQSGKDDSDVINKLKELAEWPFYPPKEAILIPFSGSIVISLGTI